MKKLKTINTTDKELSRVQDNVEAVLNVVTDKAILDGNRITNVSLTTGTTNEINHGLGRELIGWIILRKRSQADVWDLQDDSQNKKKTLSLACSADVKIDLWVF